MSPGVSGVQVSTGRGVPCSSGETNTATQCVTYWQASLICGPLRTSMKMFMLVVPV